MLESFHKAFFIGGESYICPHTFVSFYNAEMDMAAFHNFCKSLSFELARVSQITFKKLKLVQANIIQESSALGTDLFPGDGSEDMHLVVFKLICEPVQNSLADNNNLAGCLKLLQVF